MYVIPKLMFLLLEVLSLVINLTLTAIFNSDDKFQDQLHPRGLRSDSFRRDSLSLRSEHEALSIQYRSRSLRVRRLGRLSPGNRRGTQKQNPRARGQSQKAGEPTARSGLGSQVQRRRVGRGDWVR